MTVVSCCIVSALLRQGNEASLNFYLTNFTDVGSLTTAIRNIQYLGGNTNTTGGLRLMRTEVFNRANGDRSDVPNVAILITDGIPTREVEQLPGEVASIKSLGIRIVGVGVSNQVCSWHPCLFLLATSQLYVTNYESTKNPDGAIDRRLLFKYFLSTILLR